MWSCVGSHWKTWRAADNMSLSCGLDGDPRGALQQRDGSGGDVAFRRAISLYPIAVGDDDPDDGSQVDRTYSNDGRASRPCITGTLRAVHCWHGQTSAPILQYVIDPL